MKKVSFIFILLLIAFVSISCNVSNGFEDENLELKQTKSNLNDIYNSLEKELASISKMNECIFQIIADLINEKKELEDLYTELESSLNFQDKEYNELLLEFIDITNNYEDYKEKCDEKINELNQIRIDQIASKSHYEKIKEDIETLATEKQELIEKINILNTQKNITNMVMYL